jgi:prevent-host-death family protein
MESIGVRDLRQRASEILKSVEAGESVVVTVAGRPVARLVPYEPEGPQTWVSAARLGQSLTSPADPTWNDERRTFGVGDIADPWERNADRS